MDHILFHFLIFTFLLFAGFSQASPLRRRCTAGPKFSSIIVFGDSFSDNGNGTWKLTNETWPADPSYYQGRFSNGPVWPENLQTILGAKTLFDFAYGGATINNSIVKGYSGANSTILVPSVVDQVQLFLNTSLGQTDPASSLSILVAGNNDAYFAGTTGLDVRALTDSLVNSVKELVSHGFRTFIIPSTQAGLVLPYYTLYNPSGIDVQSEFSHTFHFDIYDSLSAAQLPSDVKVLLWDELAALGQLVSSAKEDGLVVDKPCLSGVYGEEPVRTLCPDPDKYVFWDAFHPTKAVHVAVAQNFAQLVSY